MSERSKNKSELELDEDMRFQRREWRVVRFAWIFLGIILLVAAAGLTGKGLFSTRTLAEPGALLAIEFEPIIRIQAPTEMLLRISAAAGDSTVKLRLGREFIEGIEVTRFDPNPASVEAARDHYTYEFNRAPAQETLVRLTYEGARVGAVPLSVGLDSDHTYSAKQTFLP